MEHSQELGELAKALNKAQGEMGPALKEAKGNYGKYADLASVWEAARGPLAANGLSVVQGFSEGEPGTDGALWTMLLHTSGQWLRGSCRLVLGKRDPQGIGSATTYYRRYGLSAVLGIYQDDDDAQSAMPTKTAQATPKLPEQKDSAQVASFKRQMEEAKTKEELKAVGLAIKAFERQLPGPTKKDLQGLYSTRMEELA